ncbi:hypothetical protein DI487_15925 [Flavobacterium sediminis]|uniref:Membrane-binding protein n=1 Tax=Flavobacterium sediminis TaxID=2201181 RepID=A0A2U8QYQ6_9FLAO|nr:hypothetical protein [Flavobacterium sediminis]AWM15199.1 hypothetical protein DI487_15925 [Flavobacterium sediminis]
MKKIFSICLLGIFLFSFTDPYTIKRISDQYFRYEFYTTDKEVNIKHNRDYYWFKGGLIHKAEGGTSGQLLDGEFKKYYHSNQLAEQGFFKRGLKIGLWKTWFEDGTTESTQEYNSGQRDGQYYSYSSTGKMLEKGYYVSGKKHGSWINYITQDTVQYKKGEIFIPKPKLTKEEKAAAKEQKKKERELKKQEKETKNASKTKITPKETKKAKSKKETKKEDTSEKQSFFKRIFSKKDKKE